MIEEGRVVPRGDVEMLQDVEDVGEDGAASRKWRGVDCVPPHEKAVGIVDQRSAKYFNVAT